MKIRLLLIPLVLLAVSAPAAAASKYAPPAEEVLTELSSRSKIPVSELKQSIADCNANQQAMNLCAFRDAVAADLMLKHAFAEWEKSRDALCEKTAQHEWRGGSMKPAARADCVATETNKMIRHIEKISPK